MNVNKRLRLNIFGYVQALLFSAMLLIFINGEAGWGMIYIIAAGIAASTVVSRRRTSILRWSAAAFPDCTARVIQ